MSQSIKTVDKKPVSEVKGSDKDRKGKVRSRASSSTLQDIDLFGGCKGSEESSSSTSPKNKAHAPERKQSEKSHKSSGLLNGCSGQNKGSSSKSKSKAIHLIDMFGINDRKIRALLFTEHN